MSGQHGVLRIYPPPPEEVEAPYSELVLPGEHPEDPGLPYVIMNMVSSLDGKTSVDGKSGSIGTKTDRETMRVLRSKADAVMVGAGTLRAEKVSLTSEGRRSPEPLAILATGSLDLPMENLLHASKENTVILAPEDAAEEKKTLLSKRARILTPPSDKNGTIDFEKALGELKSSFGVNTLLLEGGPGLNHALVSRGLVCEIFLTLSPKLLGGNARATGILAGERQETTASPELLSVHKGPEGELFLRYALEESRL